MSVKQKLVWDVLFILSAIIYLTILLPMAVESIYELSYREICFFWGLCGVLVWAIMDKVHDGVTILLNEIENDKK